MMESDKLSEALSLYNLERPQAELIRHNENMTYKITCVDNQYALRVHKPVEGFAPDLHNMNHSRNELIQSELDVISALKNGTDLPMQIPVFGINDVLVQVLADGTPVTLLEWVDKLLRTLDLHQIYLRIAEN